MKKLADGMVQAGVALAIVTAIIFFTLGFTVTGLLVSDFAFTATVILAFWLLVRARLEAGYMSMRQSRQPVVVRVQVPRQR